MSAAIDPDSFRQAVEMAADAMTPEAIASAGQADSERFKAIANWQEATHYFFETRERLKRLEGEEAVTLEEDEPVNKDGIGLMQEEGMAAEMYHDMFVFILQTQAVTLDGLRAKCWAYQKAGIVPRLTGEVDASVALLADFARGGLNPLDMIGA
jgi:hypothetical protein